MRLGLILFFLFTTYTSYSQEYFIVRAAKDSLDGFMTFYDVEEKDIKVMVSISSDINLKDYSFSYAIQNKNSGYRSLDIYDGDIPLSKPNFDYNIPINDTFINSGNYRLAFRLKKGENLLQEKELFLQTLRARNSYYQAKKTSERLIKPTITNTISDIDISKTFVTRYKLAQIKRNIDALSPIAERSEQGALEGITLNNNKNELQRFFYNFWVSRNPHNPEAAWKDYASKLNYVSRKYGYGSLRGYQTDRGMLYLKFGPPNREIRASNERGTRPYEVWFYSELDKFTNLNILFVQQGALTNERIMTHSTDPNFFFNPYWAQQLFTDPSEQFNKNSHRVYEFFK